jgi:hypothetical protein
MADDRRDDGAVFIAENQVPDDSMLLSGAVVDTWIREAAAKLDGLSAEKANRVVPRALRRRVDPPR